MKNKGAHIIKDHMKKISLNHKCYFLDPKFLDPSTVSIAVDSHVK